MRASAICIAAVFALGCGKGAIDTSNRPVTLTITTGADGLVRGAGPDCRGTCSTQVAAGTQMHGDDTVWAPLRVDDTAIYYFHGGALIKRLK
jgi:hypothetical protein